MGFLERMLGNLIGGHRGGHHGGSRHGGLGGIQAIRKTAARQSPASSAAAPIRAMRASAGNAVLPCRAVNVPVVARRCQRAPSSAASAASLNSNAAHTPL